MESAAFAIGAMSATLGVSVIASIWLSVVVHEFGHAAVAIGFGFRITRIYIGARQAPMLRFRFRANGCRVNLCFFANPVGGCIVGNLSENALANAAMTLAGPMMNILLAGVVFTFWWLAIEIPIEAHKICTNLEYGITACKTTFELDLPSTCGLIALFSLFLVNTVLGTLNLIPGLSQDGDDLVRDIGMVLQNIRKKRVS